jgi:hypothetical protein
MTKLIVIILSLALIACDPVVNKTKTTATFAKEQTSCTYYKPGYCVACTIGFNGKFSCAPGLKINCPHDGTMLADVEKWDLHFHYKSGRIKTLNQVNIIKEYEVCH